MKTTLFVIATLIAAGNASAAILTVGPVGSGADFNSLVTAVSTVNAGDELRLRSDFVEDSIVTTTKNLTIRSYNSNFTVPEPGARLDNDFAIDSSSGNVSVAAEGIIFNDQTPTNWGAVMLYGGASTLNLTNDCQVWGLDYAIVVYNNASGSSLSLDDTIVSSSRNGISVRANSRVNVSNSLIGPTNWDGIVVNDIPEITDVAINLSNTITSGSSIGMHILRPAAITMTSTTVQGCRLDGIMLRTTSAGSSIDMDQCLVAGNRTGFSTLAGLRSVSVTNSDFVFNRSVGFATNWDNAVLNIASTRGIDFGTVSNCRFSNNGHSGFLPLANLTAVFEDCEFSNNFYHGFSLQDPRKATADRSTISFADCTMDNNGQNGGTAGAGMAIDSPVTLSATRVQSTNCKAVDGLLMTAGTNTSEVTLSDSVFNNNKRHGFLDQGFLASVSISNCEFNNNFFDGLVNDSANARGSIFGTVSGSEFNDNGRAGINITVFASLNVSDSEIMGNGFRVGTGNGISRGTSGQDLPDVPTFLELTNCNLTGNQQAVSMTASAQTWTLTNCQLSNSTTGLAYLATNTANRDITASFDRCSFTGVSGGTGLVDATNVGLVSLPLSFKNCIFDGGVSQIDLDGSSATFDFCTLAAPTQTAGTALLLSDSNGASPMTVSLDRSIVSNFDAAVNAAAGITTSLTNSLLDGTVTGATTGAGVITGDPLFNDAANHNYGLQVASPAVAKVTFSPGEVDYLNVSRPQPVTAVMADMGALEVNESTTVDNWNAY